MRAPDPVPEQGARAELARRLAALPPQRRRAFIERLREQGVDGWSLLGAASGGGARRAPLSFAQERLRFLHELDPGSAQLNLFGAFRLRGPLSAAALEVALAHVAQRHEVLRSSLHADEEGGFQLVHEAQDVALPALREPSLDWTALAADEAEQRLRELALREIAQPFELGRAPLWRARLLRLAEQEHALLLVLHHAVADAWSLKVLVEDLGEAYRRALGPGALPERSAPVQYADFALWQRDWLADGPALERQLAYWRERLGGAEPPLALPGDAPPAAQLAGEAGAFAGRVERHVLSAALSRALAARAAAADLTPYMILLACFQLLLHRLGGARDVRVGSSVGARPHPELERSVGCFVNLLVLRADFTGNPCAGEFLHRTREAVLGALANQDVPFERVVEALRGGTGWSEQPLFHALFVLQNAPAGELGLDELRVERIELPERFARYELSLRAAQDRDGRTALALEYDVRRWSAHGARLLLERFERIAESVAGGADARISELPWTERALGPADFAGPLEAAAVLAPPLSPGAAAGAAPPVAADLWDAFERWALAQPQRTALITPQGSWSYAALAREAAQLAPRLAALGVGPGSVVAVCLGAGVELIAALLAVLARGACYLPLDPEWPAQRGVELACAAGACCRIDAAASAQGPAALQLSALEGGAAPLAAAGLAYAMGTSGSTGRPKLVAVAHASVLAYAAALHARVRVGADARLLWVSGVAADLGYTSVWGALCAGRTLVCAPRELALDADRLAQFMREVPVALLKIAPAQLGAALAAAAEPHALLPREVLVLGGEEARPELLRRVRELAPDCRILNHYGPTEATIGVITHELPAGAAPDAPLPLGRPFAHVRAYVLDRYGQALPEGAIGELQLGGECLARGYLGAPGLTAAAFVPDPFAGRDGVPAGARVYRTGDRVRRRGDLLEFCGRADAQLGLHGQRIEPAEIEVALREQRGVVDARVALHERGPARQLAAFVLLAPGAELDAAALRAALARRLPAALVPGLYVALPAWPLLATGKLDWPELVRLAAAAPPAAASAGGADAAGQPRSDVERRLLAIWQRVLKAEPIGVHDDFFALGGDSILALQIAARARREGLPLSPRDLFEGSSIAAIAARLAAASGVPAAEPALEVAGEIPLTPIQRWFFEQPLVHPQHYNQSVLLRLAQPLEPERLAAVLARLVEQHPVLSLRFARDAGGWRAHAQPPRPDELAALGARLLECVDLSALAADATDPQAQAAARRRALEAHCAQRQAGLSLERGELFRAVYFELGAGGARLLLLAHHLLVDGVSWRILLEDLDALYHGRALAPAGSSYREWALRLQRHAQSEELRAELEYWRALPPLSELPREFAGANRYASLAAVAASLTVAESAELLELAARRGARVDAVLLAALAPVLGQWCGQAELCLECEGHGREDFGGELELSRTVGWFTARYPLRLGASAALPAAVAIRAAGEALARVPRCGIGHGVLRQLGAAGAELGAERGPQLLFNYLGQLDRGLHGELWEAGEGEAAESAGAQRDPASPRAALLAINAQVSRGRLQLQWLFSTAVHGRASIEALAAGVLAELRRFAAELRPSAAEPCRSAAEPHRSAAEPHRSAAEPHRSAAEPHG